MKRNSPPRASRPCLCLGLAIWILPQLTHGGIFLTGISQVGTSADGTNAGGPIWNTLGNEVLIANLYVTQPNTGYTGALLNHGNGTGASISYELTPGTYQFFVSSDSFSNINPGYYAINLFFGGSTTVPGITGYSARDSSTVSVVPSGKTTLALDGTTSVQSAGSLSYESGGLRVTMTEYGFGMPGVFGGAAIDRVANLNDAPEGALDGIGIVNLQVTAVPEPLTYSVAFGIGLFTFGMVRSVQRGTLDNSVAAKTKARLELGHC